MASPRAKSGPTRAASSALRRLPRMDDLLEAQETRAIAEQHGRALVAALLRERLADLRRAARRGSMREADVEAAAAGLPAWVEAEARARTASEFVGVINATGVILHTNLGRAPLPPEAIRRVAEVAGRYSTLEY